MVGATKYMEGTSDRGGRDEWSCLAYIETLQATELREASIHVKGDTDVAEVLHPQNCREDIFRFLVEYEYLPNGRACSRGYFEG